MGFYDGRSYYVHLLLKYQCREGHKIFFVSNNADAGERVSGTGAEFFCMPFLSDKKRMLKARSVLTDFAESEKIDIIHTHHRYYELIANSLKKKLDIKTVFTALSIVDRRYFVEYRSDRIIAVSNAVKSMLINKFAVKKERIELIPNFTDTEELDSPKTSAERNDHFIQMINEKKRNGYRILLSVGRYHRDKDHMTLLRAVSEAEEKKYFTLIIGNGDEENNYSDIIREKKIDAALIPGQKNLRPFYNAADICILCSKRDPLPGFMLQSGLFKKPFIGSDTDGIKEVIEDNVNGLIFRKGNFIELKDKINLLTKSRTFSEKLASALHGKVMKDYTEKKIIPQIESVYKSLKENQES